MPAQDGVLLHVATCGDGPDVLVLSGGPGCVHYLADETVAPAGFRCWFPDPRGVARSGGGPHDMARAVEDLEDVRRQLGLESWLVLGHSWGSDLAVRYAIEHPDRVDGVVGIAGHGMHSDRDWSTTYEAAKAAGEDGAAPDIAWEPAVHDALKRSFRDWIHEPALWRALADSEVGMWFVAAGKDIRPDWPLQQLARLVRRAGIDVVPDVPHDFWDSHPDVWRAACEKALQRFT